MRTSHVFHILVITFCATHGLAQEGVRVRVGPDIGVDTRGDGVRIQVGPLRIRVGGDSVGRPVRLSNRAAKPVISRFLSDRTLIEAPVLSQQNRAPGQLQDIVFDTQTGRLRYAAVSYPNIESGRRLFAVPFSVLDLEWQPRRLMWRTNFEGRPLTEAPQFDAEHWPVSADPLWADEVDSYYGAVVIGGDLVEDEGELVQDFETVPPPPPVQQQDRPQLERVSRLIGQPLLDSESKDLGSVRGLILDRETGLFRYAAIQDHARADNSATLAVIPVPMQLLTCVAVEEEETVQLHTGVSADQVLNAPRIRLERALRPGHEDWTAGVDAYFRVTPPKEVAPAVSR